MKSNRHSRFTLMLARYPLTLYFGLLFVLLGGTVLYLHYHFQWDFNFQQLSMWLNRHASVILAVVTLLLGMVLVGNAIAYRQTCNLVKEEYDLWLHQRATRTFFPMFTPFHDWLRLRLTIYRWWHTRPYASSVHLFLLLVVLGFSFNSIKVASADSPDTCDQDLTVTSPVSWSGVTCYRNVTVNGGGTLTIAGGSTVTLTSFTVGTAVDSTGIVSIQGDTLNNVGVTMTISGDTTVASGSSISASGQGYAGGVVGSRNGNGPGGGTAQGGTLANTSAGGGGYGGAGATVSGFAGGGTYGTSTSPTDLGSGGGFVFATFVGNNGGAGGGALKATTGGTLTVAGTIAANGVSALKAGGGSGGSIWLVANTCSGSGTISANGGNGGTTGGGGGGGRIYRQCTVLGSGTPTVTATKGTSGTGAGDGTALLAEVTQSLSVTGLSTSTTAGSVQTLTVTAINTDAGTATSYRGTVHFTATDSQAVLPSNYTFTAGDNGVKTFSVVLKTSGSATVTVTDTHTSSITGNQATTVTPGAAANYGVTFGFNPSAHQAAGSALSPTITAKDAYGNTVTTYTGTIAFSSSDSQAVLPGNYTFQGSDAGTKIFTNQVIFKTAGDQTVTVGQVASLPGASSVTGTSSAVTVEASTVNQLDLSAVSTSLQTGEAAALTLRATDVYGNVAGSYTGTVRFSTAEATTTLPADHTFTGSDAGSKSWNDKLVFQKVGTQTITVTDTNSAGLSASLAFTVRPGAIVSYQLTTTAQPQYTNRGWVETVKAKDRYDNLVDTDSTTVLTPTTTSQAKFYNGLSYTKEVSSYQLVNGQARIFVKDAVAEKVVIVIRDSTGLSVASRSITILNGSAGSNQTVGGAGSVTESFGVPDQLPLTPDTEVNLPPLLNPLCDPNEGSASVNSAPTNFFQQTCKIAFDNISRTLRPLTNLIARQPLVAASSTFISSVAPVAALIGFAPISVSLVTAVSGTVAQGGSAVYLLLTGLVPLQMRRRRRWGTARNAVTGLPIPGVFVELLGVTGQPLGRTLTDKTGRYGFLVQKPGKYQIKIDNPLYGTYLSRLITIKEPAKELVLEDVSLLAINQRVNPRLVRALNLIKLINFFSFIYWPLLIIGSLIIVVLLFQAVTVFRLTLALIYLLVWVIKLFEFQFVKPFGLVVDEHNRPQALTVVQLSEVNAEGRQIVHSTITDAKGRFLFTVKPNKYQLMATKQGFEPLEKTINGSESNIKLQLQASP